MKYIKIDNDKWDDAGKIWFVHEYETNPNTTAVKLTLEDTTTGEIHTRFEPRNHIEWIEEE